MSLNVSNGYVPKYTPIKDRDFLSYLDDLKFEKFMENPDQSFRNTKIVNFDIIHHECRGDKLNNSYEHYQTVFKDNFKNYIKRDKKTVLSSALRNQNKLQQSIYFEKDLVISHFKSYGSEK